MSAKLDAPAAAPKMPAIIFVYVAIAGLASVLFGYEMSNISGAKLDFAASHGLSASGSEVAFLAAGLSIGATLGCVIAGYLQDRLGRKITLIIAVTTYIGGVVVSFFSAAFPQLAAGRVVTGLAVGIISSTVPMFIGELSPPAVRGSLVTVNQVCICTGILLGYVASMFLTPHWDYEFGCGVPLAALLLVLFVFVTPYSPRWLLSKGRAAEARVVLLRIRNGDEAAVDAEIDGIQKVLLLSRAAQVVPVDDDEASERGGVAPLLSVNGGDDAAAGSGAHAAAAASTATTPWQDLFQPHVRWAVTVGVMMSLIAQFTGCNAVNAYAQTILQDAGFNSADSNLQAIFIGVTKLAMVVIALIVMDKFGRRTLLLAGIAGMTLSLGGLAFLLQQVSINGATKAVSYGAAGCLFAYMSFFELSLGPVVWLLLAELFPLKVRGLAMSVGSTSNWAFTTCVTLSFNSLKNALQAFGVFYLFTAICIASFLWVWMYVPETRGKSLEEIEHYLIAQTSGKPKAPLKL